MSEINKIRKKLIVFDLDNTLALSKSKIDGEMAGLLSFLLAKKKVAIISGGQFKQIESQVLPYFLGKVNLKNLFILPTCGAAFYMWDNGWKEVYSLKFSSEEKRQILSAFEKSFMDLKYDHPAELYGEIFEDRGSQITFSAFGQNAPLFVKRDWDPNGERRLKIKEALASYLNNFEIRVGGSTSIDITKKGIDKAFGILQLEKYVEIKKDNMLFVGDAIFPGGNDYSVKQAGVECIQVSGPEDTKRVVLSLI